MRKRTANRQSGTDPPAKKLELVTFPINLNQLLAQQERYFKFSHYVNFK